jgi:flagellar assembly factor FliW
MMTVAALTRPDEERMTPPGAALPTIDFVVPMPGFPEYRRYVLVRIDDDGVLYALTSVDDPELRFLVVPPPPFFPNYAPEIGDETLELLGAPEADQLLLLLVVTAIEGQITANLMAPIVVDQVNRRAVQTVLSGSGLPVRAQMAASG